MLLKGALLTAFQKIILLSPRRFYFRKNNKKYKLGSIDRASGEDQFQYRNNGKIFNMTKITNSISTKN